MLDEVKRNCTSLQDYPREGCPKYVSTSAKLQDVGLENRRERFKSLNFGFPNAQQHLRRFGKYKNGIVCRFNTMGYHHHLDSKQREAKE